ncbi:MAG: PilC/PilY family type IV pilus protein, partial [Pseudomonadota bacterium]|nr:PilC/PilY family type IV pilus protein [Pseudomonadota bacterium]
ALTPANCKATKNSSYKYAKYGTFTRYAIKSGLTYPKATERSDCVTTAGLCTYVEEMTNFANWYTYYRTRMLMTKTAVGRAFQPIGNDFRIGFMTIQPTGASLGVAPFEAGHKAAWYGKLYDAPFIASTPLRPALSRVGNYYGGNTGSLGDPIEYSCQRNFAILSTDGFWNGGAGYTLSGGAIGNQDNVLTSAPRPKYDGNVSGASETLADVAMYYYKTDLRDPSRVACNTGAIQPDGSRADVCANNVAGSSKDAAAHQHMTTFTIGLGVNGELAYRADYEQAASGDFAQLKTGAINWPKPISNTSTAVDDLWHAAVNGAGSYYSARNPQALAYSIEDLLKEIGEKTGAAAAAATSNPNVVAGDNFLFSTTFRTVFWDGDLVRQQIDPSSGALSAVEWRAQPLVDSRVSASTDTRTIHTYSGSGLTKLKAFTWTTLTSAEQAYFNPPSQLTGYSLLSGAGKSAATGQNMVNYLRGQNALEDDTGDADKPFRGREHVLGDFANAKSVYVRASLYSYSDAGHSAFRVANETRQGMVYAAANDGMLHAFNATTGEESWAFIPKLVIQELYKLADKSYPHRFYVDGSPAVGDIFDGSAWRTILVGGLGAGGTGYYALDVTDPASPKALWEFTHADLGLSFGNPLIAKLKSGQWVVMFTSGYNNANGGGHLFVVDATSGALLYKIGTGAGSAGNPSGLGKINMWIKDPKDYIAEMVYGGDLNGNLWRFDVNDSIAPSGREAFLLAELGGPPGAGVQPISSKPELGQVDGFQVVFVGTGKLLGISDLSDSSLQSFYAIKDPLDGTAWGKVRAGAGLVKQEMVDSTLASGQPVRTNAPSSKKKVDWANPSVAGWYFDFIDSRERSNTDAILALGTITFSTNVPSVEPCVAGGYSWLYYLDFKTGTAVTTAATATNSQGATGQKLGNAMSTGSEVVKLSGTGKTVTISTLADNTKPVTTHPTPGKFKRKRAGWREIMD